MASTRLSFSYQEDMRDQLKSLAEADGRSLSSYIQRILQKHLDSQGDEVAVPKKRAIKRKKSHQVARK